MNKLKIISHPYDKVNLYKVFNDATEQWIDINIENNPNSKLIKTNFREGFFPFIVNDLIKEIVNEYGVSNELLELYFEGTKEDFEELEKVCQNYKDITLKKDAYFLNSAPMVLEEIIKVFRDLRPIIDRTQLNKEAVDSNIDKFSEVTNNLVPLCIMGNCSAGKSTFINALIGNEILPSGDEPVTAKVFKIYQADYQNAAFIRLQKDDQLRMIMFYEDGYEFREVDDVDPLFVELKKELDLLEGTSITTRINKALSIINKVDVTNTSDIVEISIPFNGGLWKETDTKFVILDTPGSNSATNAEHTQVLEKALGGLTNGLTIYVSEFDSLDSMDNKALLEKMHSMEELDSRFSLIIANKADENDLPEEGYCTQEKEDELLGYATPKHLYTEGIFFVSSILGLGAKTKGKFISKHLNRIYRKTSFMFDDKEDEDYTVLYRYNIMPKQLKSSAEEFAKNYDQSTDENLIYANSGLLSVEHEIQNYASNYASYNKCKKSTTYLANIIDMVNDEISKSISKRKQVREDLINHLEEDKKELVNVIQEKSNEKQAIFIDDSKQFLIEYIENSTPKYEYDKIKDIESKFTREQEIEFGFELTSSELKNAKNQMSSNFFQGLDEVRNNFGINSLKNLAKDIIDDTKDTFEKNNKYHSTVKEINRAAAKQLLEYINDEHKQRLALVENQLIDHAQNFWTWRAKEIKDMLSTIITGTTALSDEKRTEISSIIMTYQDLVFEKYKKTSYEVQDFVNGFKIGNFMIFEADTLNINKLVSSYNDLLLKFSNEVEQILHESYSKSYVDWLQNLLSIITKNIISYSPELSLKQKEIEDEENKIQELKDCLKKIENGVAHIENMMSWHKN